MTFKLPTSFTGPDGRVIDGKKAYDEIMSRPDVQVLKAKTITPQSNLENVLVIGESNKIFVLDNMPNAVPIEIASRSYSIQALCSHNGKLYDGGYYKKIFETLTGREIASRRDYVHALCSHPRKYFVDAGVLK